MINSACERIKELESELLEKDIAYKAMMEQRDALVKSCMDALSWIDSDTRQTLGGWIDNIESSNSLDTLEEILSEHLK